MPDMAGIPTSFLLLIERGGPVVPVIIATSILLWTLIIERYWFYIFEYPGILSRTARRWRQRDERTSWYARRIREGLISELSLALRRHLLAIQVLVSILPLLGLLGTVTGMIATFDILNRFGSSDTGALSVGISKALLPTTAGLVTAIAGLYFSNDLQQRSRTQIHQVSDKLH
ncbi:MAG: MotA/TolQ/ExbB proton channel family protein [Gammaproteobacteria bacterium]|nr:MotA/TolQ/ExbB proton channel family protein [Gammaproteobacteria bacterium]